jgi:hypothetical protein
MAVESTIFDWVRAALSVPKAVPIIGAEHPTGFSPSEHNQATEIRLTELSGALKKQVTQPDFCSFDPEAVKVALIPALKHETSREMRWNAVAFWQASFSTLPANEALERAVGIFQELASISKDEGKFRSLLREASYEVNDISGLQKRFASLVAQTFKWTIGANRFPLVVPGKNADIEVSTVGGRNLRDVLVEMGTFPGQQGYSLHRKIMDSFDTLGSVVGFSFYKEDDPEEGRKRYLEDLNIGKIILAEYKQTADFLTNNLLYDSIDDFVENAKNAQYIAIAEVDHYAPFTKSFWANDTILDVAHKNEIPLIGIEGHHDHQVELDGYLKGDITREEFIARSAEKTQKLEAILSSVVTDRTEDAFARARGPSLIKEFWEERAKFVDRAKNRSLGVFHFDGWEGTIIENGHMKPHGNLRTSSDHLWANRIQDFCGVRRAILRIGALHEELDEHLGRENIARLLLCGSVRSLSQQTDLSRADGAILANHRGFPIVKAPSWMSPNIRLG